MIIAVALDNVVTTYIKTFQTYMAEMLHVPEEEIENVLPSDTTPDFENWQHVKEDLYSHQVQAFSKGILKTMGVADDASDVLWKLSNEGHHIRITTSRFLQHGQNHKVIAHTGEWLDRNDIPYRDLVFIHDRTEVNADVYIEALPVNIKTFEESNRQHIVFNQPYNTEIETSLRAYGWKDVYTIINRI